jgi:hypothetical protein
MYQIIPQQIPQDRRAEINEKILFCIDTGKNQLHLLFFFLIANQINKNNT